MIIYGIGYKQNIKGCWENLSEWSAKRFKRNRYVFILQMNGEGNQISETETKFSSVSILQQRLK